MPVLWEVGLGVHPARLTGKNVGFSASSSVTASGFPRTSSVRITISEKARRSNTGEPGGVSDGRPSSGFGTSANTVREGEWDSIAIPIALFTAVRSFENPEDAQTMANVISLCRSCYRRTEDDRIVYYAPPKSNTIVCRFRTREMRPVIASSSTTARNTGRHIA